jgi:hypothetical protein
MQVPILFPLSDRQLWQLARVLTPRNFAKGETVFRQGDVADKFYICQKGAFSCFTSEWRHVTCNLRLALLLSFFLVSTSAKRGPSAVSPVSGGAM